MAQHEELDLQTHAPVLPSQGLLQEEPPQAGRRQGVSLSEHSPTFFSSTSAPSFLLFLLLVFLLLLQLNILL